MFCPYYKCSVHDRKENTLPAHNLQSWQATATSLQCRHGIWRRNQYFSMLFFYKNSVTVNNLHNWAMVNNWKVLLFCRLFLQKGSLILLLSHSKKTNKQKNNSWHRTCKSHKKHGKVSCAVHQSITLCLRSLQCLCSERTWDKACFWERKDSSTICTNVSDYHCLSKRANCDPLLFFQNSGDDSATYQWFFSLQTLCCLFVCLHWQLCHI